MSQIKNYRYDWIWHKTQSTGHLNAKIQPLRQHEIISVFYRSLLKYNPQIIDKKKENIRPPQRGRQPETYGKSVQDSPRKIPINKTYPRSVIQFANCNKGEAGLHPTQKPVALLEYLIRTYTNEGEIVLDNVMGSGSTGVACLDTGRLFIGIEKDDAYFKIAKKRIGECLG
jgi:site-specific DNA-methyltransferase (adenine-specific)